MARVLVALRWVWRGLWSLIATVGIFLLWKRQKEAAAHDEAAGAFEDEASKVKEAGERGDAEAVLDSFRRSTDK